MLELNSETLEPEIALTLSQYPIKLAYAITIHKSQGMSLEALVCNLDFLFAPSQLYVATSRAIEPRLLKIEYSRADFNSYLTRVISQNDIVNEFYRGLKIED
jgi:ATP-dependent exoDNAse (exonuclease V) alpha subunit